MRKLQLDVAEFMAKVAGHPMNLRPGAVTVGSQHLNWALVRQESTELLNAIKDNNVPEVADGIVDLIYVALHTANTYGIDIAPLWEEVHSCNLKKIGGAKDVLGKQLKPEGWQPPRIESMLTAQFEANVPLITILEKLQ